MKKVLISRFSSIGDIVLCTPVIRCVKQQMDCEVHFITKERYASVLAANPYIDKFITINEKVDEARCDLQSESYDLYIDLHKNIRSQQVRRIVKTKYITFDKLNVQKWLAVYTPYNPLPDKHLVDRYFEALEEIGVVNDGLGLDHHYSAKMMDGVYVVVVLGATYATKRIPLEKLRVLIESTRHKVVLLGGDDVQVDVERLKDMTSVKFVNKVGKSTLDESSAIVAGAQYVVTGDTGMMHIAAAHDVPIILFWGSTHPTLGMYPYLPKGSTSTYIPLVKNLSCQPCSKVGKHQCPKGHFKCMLDISDQEIVNAVNKMETK